MVSTYSITKIIMVTINTELVFFLTGVGGDLQVIVNVTANKLRGAKLVPRLNFKWDVFPNGCV